MYLNTEGISLKHEVKGIKTTTRVKIKFVCNYKSVHQRCFAILLLIYISRHYHSVNPLPDMPILAFSNSAANKDMMS